MKIIWLGHASFRIEIGDQVLLLDPWFEENPMFPDDQRQVAIEGATAILMTHGHVDHVSSIPDIAKGTDIPVVGLYELAEWMQINHGLNTIGFGKGGTIQLGDVSVSLVNAVHSSSIKTDSGRQYVGCESGFMIEGEGHTIYASGDTDIMADMEWMGDYYKPDIGILCAGGHFTMDMAKAAYAAKRYFNFKTVIPCHYKTFPVLEQSAQVLIDGLSDTDIKVIEPEVMTPIVL